MAGKKPADDGKLRQIRDMMKRVFKDDDPSVDIDTASLTKPLPFVPTGSVILDYVIGGKPNANGVAPCPGLPKGRIMQLYGAEGTGKTTLALTACAAVCKRGGKVVYVDFENELVPAYAKKLGVPVDDEDRFLLAQPETLEDGMRLLYMVSMAGIELVVIDSVGAGVPSVIAERKIEEQGNRGQIGAVAQRWSEFLPQLKGFCAQSGTTVIGISQLRQGMSTGPMAGHGEQDIAQGGKAWRFYSSLRMMLRRKQGERAKTYNALTHTTEDQLYGNVVRVRLDKCKVSPNQGGEADFYIRFGEGIDDFRSIAEIAIAHGIIKKSGSWLSYTRKDGSEVKAQGMEQFRPMLIKDKALWDDLRTKTLDTLSQVGAPATTAAAPEEIDPLPGVSFLTGVESAGKPEDENPEA